MYNNKNGWSSVTDIPECMCDYDDELHTMIVISYSWRKLMNVLDNYFYKYMYMQCTNFSDLWIQCFIAMELPFIAKDWEYVYHILPVNSRSYYKKKVKLLNSVENLSSTIDTVFKCGRKFRCNKQVTYIKQLNLLYIFTIHHTIFHQIYFLANLLSFS